MTQGNLLFSLSYIQNISKEAPTPVRASFSFAQNQTRMKVVTLE